MAVCTNFSAYLESMYPADSTHGSARDEETLERQTILADYPYSVMLQVAVPELDYANRWCWNQFGPAAGECTLQKGSEYAACAEVKPHAHNGSWLVRFLAKTNYNYGFAEWYFVDEPSANSFLSFVPRITWGEHYPEK